MARRKKDHITTMEEAQRLAAQTEMRLNEINRRFAITNWGGDGTKGKQSTLVFECDNDGRVLHMRTIDEFPKHPDLLGKIITIGDVTYPLAPFWLEWPHAKKYNRLLFAPPGSK